MCDVIVLVRMERAVCRVWAILAISRLSLGLYMPPIQDNSVGFLQDLCPTSIKQHAIIHLPLTRGAQYIQHGVHDLATRRLG